MGPSKLILLSPLQGWSAPLEEAPDPVFSGRMMGDGVAIDPTGMSLHAPCDGVLIVVPDSKHAVTIRAANGAEILLHVGIDTVGLAGAGFELHVQQGQTVRAGDRLISFDLEVLARGAKSLMTPVLVTDLTGLAISRRSENCALRVGEFLMEVVSTADDAVDAGAVGAHGAVPAIDGMRSAAPAAVTAPATIERRVLVLLEHGIHARPAATLAAAVKKLSADVFIVFGEKKANAKSPVALMSLGVRKGDSIVIRASGADAEGAIETAERAIGSTGHVAAASGGGGATGVANDTVTRAVAAGASPPHRAAGGAVAAAGARPSTVASNSTAAAPADAGAPSGALKGVVASRGLAIGTAFQFARATIEVTESGAGPSHEAEALDHARDMVRADLQRTVHSNNATAREVAEAHLGLIEDPELVEGAHALIEQGKSAGYAWRAVLREGIEQLRALNDPRMAERADDLLDLETRVLSVLSGDGVTAPQLPPDSILIANELLPSQLVALDNSKLAGICLAGGGATSHMSIIAGSLDIPTIVAVGHEALSIPSGTAVILDADAGWLHVNPPRSRIDSARTQLLQKRERRAAEQLAAQREGRTSDGTRVEVFANVGSEAEARGAVLNGAEGSGLLRTEFLFLERTSPPDEAEQLEQYQKIATALDGRPLTIRTLDIGGDKPIPYLPLPHEDNPALGLRGVRTSLWRPDLLRIQLRAILGVQPAGQCRILLPMITDVSEIRTVRTMLEELMQERARQGPISVGAMIETPASALMADRLAPEVDFLSVGTNDLTQYTLAMDRGHPDLAARLDALHPAVLRLIATVVGAARSHGKSVAVCGGLASDPEAVPILIGLGVHELSMIPAVIPQLKSLISTQRLDDCVALATAALDCETAAAVRALTPQKSRARP